MSDKKHVPVPKDTRAFFFFKLEKDIKGLIDHQSELDADF